ncbi:MAG: hypothetical protein KAT35_00050 [Candidatus Aenigmarchaeota archaeon]|nr:hypothetical protein [Candidatus Aenigmarchaeota archaeon]
MKNKQESEFLKSDQKKIEILMLLSDEKWHSYHNIHNETTTDFYSLKKHLSFMERLQLVELRIVHAEESATRASYSAKITTEGRGFLDEFRKRDEYTCQRKKN